METVVAPDSQAPLGTEGKKQKKIWKFLIAFLILIAAGAAVWFVWGGYFSPEAKRARETERNYEKYAAWEKAYEDAMRQDTYGGKTPEETLRMFIDALKKGDIDLASKYFMLETNEKSPDYLTRRKWKDVLSAARSSEKIGEVIQLLENAENDPSSAINSEYSVFSMYDRDGKYVSDIDFRFNKFSNVWKIESL